MKRVILFSLAILAVVFVLASSAPAQELLYEKPGGLVSYFKAADGRVLVRARQGGTLSGAPDYEWWYGCSPTSAGMLMGFYDRRPYGGREYPNLVPGVVADANTYANPTAAVNGIIASQAHIDAFYVAEGNFNDDPNPGSHTSGSFNCLADFMGTSQDSCSNPDGTTTFWFWQDGSAMTPAGIEGLGASYILTDGMYGIKEYIEFRGYSFSALKTQKKYGFDSSNPAAGFSYNDFKTEINAGRPVLVHIEGHTMLGYGYSDSPTPQTIFVRDTWDAGTHTMTWNGLYPATIGAPIFFLTTLTPSGGDLLPPKKFNPAITWFLLLDE